MRYIFILFMLFTIKCFSQNNNTQIKCDTGYHEITEAFFDKLPNSSDDAIDYVFGTNPWTKDAVDKINALKSSLRSTINLVGKYYGNDQIVTKSIGCNFVLCSYLVKYSRQPIRFNFVFYKPNDKWVLYNLKYDDRLSSELEEAATIDRLYENLPKKIEITR